MSNKHMKDAMVDVVMSWQTSRMIPEALWGLLSDSPLL